MESWFSMTCGRERQSARDVGQTAVGKCLALFGPAGQCASTHSFHALECSEEGWAAWRGTVTRLQNTENRWGGRCPCRDALAFSHHSNQEKRSLSPSESSVKNQTACSIRNVLCELPHGRKPHQNRLFSIFFFLFL